MGPLMRMLAARSPRILDGAVGTELQRRGVDIALPLWSANALVAHPEAVQHIHEEYIAAGAEIITANTFRTTRRTFGHARLPDRSRQMTAAALDLALRARASFPDREILIAGSIAPLEDCYRPDLVPPDAALREEHAELAGRLACGGADILLLETMGTVREAYAACEAAMATGKETVVSFICDAQGQLYSGESLAAAVRTVAELHPTAFSINCVSPRFLDRPIGTIQSATTLPLAVYGNVGVPDNERGGREFTCDIGEEEYAQWAQRWQQAGVSIIGGCCGTTPAYIAALRRILPQRH